MCTLPRCRCYNLSLLYLAAAVLNLLKISKEHGRDDGDGEAADRVHRLRRGPSEGNILLRATSQFGRGKASAEAGWGAQRCDTTLYNEVPIASV